jgi:hypothetical protein
MEEVVEQKFLNRKREWLLWSLTAFLLITVGEVLRRFDSLEAAKNFVCFSIGSTFSYHFVLKSKNSLAKEALITVIIYTIAHLSFSFFSPFLNNFMPAYLAYGLPPF